MLVTEEDFLNRSPGVTEAPDGIWTQLELAQQRVEGYLRRPLEAEQRTEVVQVGRDGLAYPSSYPVLDVEGNAEVVDSRAVRIHSMSGARVTLTYTAGYDTETVPVEIVDAIVATAAAALDADQFPEGATSVRAGDLAVTFGEGGFASSSTGLPGGVASSIRKYKRKV